MAKDGPAPSVAAVRRFNRFYTRKIGILQDGLFGSPFSLAQVRVLYEVAHRRLPTAAELCRDLGLDPGYLSRILGDFEGRGFLLRTRSDADGRKNHLALTDRGREVLAPLDARSNEEVGAMLAGLAAAERDRLVEAMRVVEEILGDRPRQQAGYLLRSHRPGDMGWVIHRHGVLYAREQGWDERFEALVAGIVARFIEDHDPARERCWIAEGEAGNLGCVFLVEKSRTVAQLRLLLVEPEARGRGIGRRLVEECVRFARQAGYRKLVLWTHGGLNVARVIYEKTGFSLVHRKKDRKFGRDVVDETWEMAL